MENNTVEKLSQEAEKQIIQLLEVTGQPNILSAINYVKTLQAGIKEDREVYVPVSVENELPAKEGWYTVTSKHGFFMHLYFYSRERSYEAWNALAGTWLKKVKLSELIGGVSDKKESV